MKKEDFFIKHDEQPVDLEVHGQVFKFKTITAGDELDWIDDYTEEKEFPQTDGSVVVKKVQNTAKLTTCMLRNVVEIPFKDEELKQITGNAKPWKEYCNSDKDLLFRQMNPRIMDELINKIKEIQRHSKKD